MLNDFDVRVTVIVVDTGDSAIFIVPNLYNNYIVVWYIQTARVVTLLKI